MPTVEVVVGLGPWPLDPPVVVEPDVAEPVVLEPVVEPLVVPDPVGSVTVSVSVVSVVGSEGSVVGSVGSVSVQTTVSRQSADRGCALGVAIARLVATPLQKTVMPAASWSVPVVSRIPWRVSAEGAHPMSCVRRQQPCPLW